MFSNIGPSEPKLDTPGTKQPDDIDSFFPSKFNQRKTFSIFCSFKDIPAHQYDAAIG